jgi:hypothetical protein
MLPVYACYSAVNCSSILRQPRCQTHWTVHLTPKIVGRITAYCTIADAWWCRSTSGTSVTSYTIVCRYNDHKKTIIFRVVNANMTERNRWYKIVNQFWLCNMLCGVLFADVHHITWVSQCSTTSRKKQFYYYTHTAISSVYTWNTSQAFRSDRKGLQNP